MQRTEFFVILGHFLPVDPPNNPKNQNFEKIKKMAGDIILHLCRYHKWQSYNVWFLRYWAQQAGFFVILGCFLPFYFPNNPENKNLEKMKKAPEDVIILHMSTINENHICMIPEMWSTTDRFSSHFGSFYTPHRLTTQRIKILKKWKKKNT